MEKRRTQSLHFWSNLDLPFPPEDGGNQKVLRVVRKKFSNWIIQICQNEGSISSLFPGKNGYFLHCLDCFWQETGGTGAGRGSEVKGLESKFDISSFIHMIPGQLLVKRFWFQRFPVLWLQVTKDITQNFNPDCENWLHFLIPCFNFWKHELELLMQEFMLNQLTTILNPKNEKPKSSYALF